MMTLVGVIRARRRVEDSSVRKSNVGFDLLCRSAGAAPGHSRGVRVFGRMSTAQKICPLWIVVVSTALGLTCLTIDAFAQPSDKRMAKPATPSKNDAKSKASETGGVSKKAEPSRSTGAAELPPDWDPPPPTNPQMLIDKPLPLPKGFDRKKRDQFGKLRRAGSLGGDADNKLVEDQVKWRIATMSLKENRENVWKIRSDILNVDLKTVAGVTVADAVHELYLKRLIPEVEKLLDNHLVVRINAVMLLGALNTKDADPRNDIKEQIYLPAVEPLLTVLNDKDQLESVKIPAAKGIARFASDATAKGELKYRAVNALLDQLQQSKGSHYWYQRSLIEALQRIGIAEDANKRPVVVQALAKVLADPDRHPIVRSDAAWAIGRLPLSGTKLDPIAREIVSLALKMAEDYKLDPRAPYFSECFFKLYLAFMPLDSREKQRGYGLLEQVQKPLLAPYRKIVEDAYKQVLPLAKRFLPTNSDIDLNEQIKSMKDWLGSNPQSSLSEDTKSVPAPPPTYPNLQRKERQSPPPAG